MDTLPDDSDEPAGIDNGMVGVVLFAGGDAPDELIRQVLEECFGFERTVADNVTSGLYDAAFSLVAELSEQQAHAVIAKAERVAKDAGHKMVLRPVRDPAPLRWTEPRSNPAPTLRDRVVGILIGGAIFGWLLSPLVALGLLVWWWIS